MKSMSIWATKAESRAPGNHKRAKNCRNRLGKSMWDFTHLNKVSEEIDLGWTCLKKLAMGCGDGQNDCSYRAAINKVENFE